MSLMVALKSRVLWGERCYGMLHYNFNSMEQERRTSDKSFVCTGVYKSYWLAPRSFSSRSLSRALRRSLTPCTRAFLHLPIFLDHRNLTISPSSCSVSKHSKFKKKEKIWKDWFFDEARNQKGWKKMMRSCAFSHTQFYPPYRHDPVGCISCKRMNIVDCKEIVEPRVAGGIETRKFGIKRVDEGQTSTVKR